VKATLHIGGDGLRVVEDDTKVCIDKFSMLLKQKCDVCIEAFVLNFCGLYVFPGTDS